MWFDHFYRTNIIPVFYVETLADLKKKPRGTRTGEDFVRDVAFKTPELHSVPNKYHGSLVVASLLGEDIKLNDFRPIIGGGIPTNSNGEKGYRFEVAPEAEAFNRWQDEDFYVLEKEFAQTWRTSIKNMTFEFSRPYVESLGIDINSCKNLSDAYHAAERVILIDKQPMLFASFLITLNVPKELHHKIIEDYQLLGNPSINKFSPYAAYVLHIDIFFYISVARGFISGERPSNKVDMSYLYYLPFCNIFISGDKLHKSTAQFFMKGNQKFIWAPELKADLNNLNNLYSLLPLAEKELGLHSFATYPPKDKTYLTTSLWDTYLPKWRTIMQNKKKPLNDEASKKLLKELQKHARAPQIEGNDIDYNEENVKHMTLKRNVSKQRGSWYQLPKSLKH